MGNNIIIEQLQKGKQVLNVIRPEPGAGASLNDLVDYLADKKTQVEEMLLQSGAILFRDFALDGRDDFLQVKQFFAGDSGFKYVDGNSPRTKLSADVYTSTEYPKEFRISLHNELSYSNKWPHRIFFYCDTPAEEGGETPITDSRYILDELNGDIVNSFEKFGVKYTRYLASKKGPGKSWMDTFETNDKKTVEEFCAGNGMDYSWDGDCLFISHVGTGIAKHPVTNERVWFNQANQFHPSSLPGDIYRMLKKAHEKNKRRFPQYAFYGNGEEIPEEYLHDITEAHFDCALTFRWQKGDLLMLDNMLMSHGRMPFKGDRKVLVSMC